MKRIILLLLSFWVLNTNGQELRGHLVKANLCEFLDSGGYRVIKTNTYYQTFAKVTQEQFYVSGSGIHFGYKLYDKQVDSSDKTDWVVHFLSDSYKRHSTVAVKMCGELLNVAVFPMTGTNRFMEYYIKLRKPKE